jgi:carbonic anhydrase
MITAQEALSRLRDGNRRYVDGEKSDATLPTPTRRSELVSGQSPFAIILGCSDSRVPIEHVFDQGLGDLFVIRVAGNIVGSSQLGSVEFAVDELGAPLVVVLGHSRCGAVSATVNELLHPAGGGSPHLRSLIDRIRPAVEPLMVTGHEGDPEALVRDGVRSNVRLAVDQLRKDSAILREKIERNQLLIVGAEYSLETGAVDFFEGVPSSE